MSAVRSRMKRSSEDERYLSSYRKPYGPPMTLEEEERLLRSRYASKTRYVGDALGFDYID